MALFFDLTPSFFIYYPAHVESDTYIDMFIITSLKVRHYINKIHFILN